ncbi:MAG: PQQ-binding-like beta-propeller repeat protein [Planctomycetaceae bacterium]
MSDENQIATAPSSPTATSHRRGLRWKPAFLILLLCAGGIISSSVLVADRTSLVINIYRCVGLTFVALLGWWCFASRASLRTKLLGLIGVLAVIGGVVSASVRRLEFTGDMVPRFHWRWEPSAEERTAEWLQQNAPAATVASASEDTQFQITADDWPRYCGFAGARLVSEPKPDFDWDSIPPQEVWRHPVGEAWSSFAIVGSRLFTQEQRGPQECVTCYDADTGVELWRHEDSARFDTAMGGIGPRATPTVADDALFALGATGILNCLNPVTGESIWQRNILDDASARMLDWAMSGSPLLFENLVLVDAGGQQDKAVIAYDRASGAIVWAAGKHIAGYAAPRIEQISGKAQLLIFHGEGLQGRDPHSGEELWNYPFVNMYHINVAQPIRFDNRIFLSNGYDGGCVLIDPTAIENGVPQEVWPMNRNLKLKFNEAVSRNGYIYGLDDGILSCLEASTGERIWKGGRYRYGQVLLWDNVLIVQAEAGYVAAVAAEPDGYREISRFAALSNRQDGLIVKAWNVPVVNRGRLYIRDAYEMACFDLR